MRFGGWTFEQNARYVSTNTLLNLDALRQGFEPYSLGGRKLMDSIADFESAVNALTSMKFAAPQYFIIAGSRPYQGAAISVDRGGKRLPTTPPVQYLQQARNKWYLVQTNDDLLMPSKDLRRKSCKDTIEAVGQQAISVESILRIMQTWPVFNQYTAYTWVASPTLGTHLLRLHNDTLLGFSVYSSRSFLRLRHHR